MAELGTTLRKTMRNWLKILAICLAIGAPVASQAQVRPLVVAQGNCKSLNQAVEEVRRQYNGRIVSANTRVSGNRETHHIKVLTKDGTVKTVKVPGCTRRNG